MDTTMSRRRWLLLSLFIALVCFIPSYAYADFLDEWNIRSPLPSEFGLHDIAYINGSYMAVGGGGTIVTSTDARNWSKQSSGITNSIRSVEYGNGTYVAVGESGRILTSGDGANWSIRTSGTAQSLLGVVYHDGIFVAAGWNGTIVTSDDGENWISRTSGTSSHLSGVEYLNGMFVAIGANGTILISHDAVNWTQQGTATTDYLFGAAYGNGKYVAVGIGGRIVTSTDGTSWQNQSLVTMNFLYDVAFAKGEFVAVGTQGTILASNDGINWSYRTSGTSNTLWGIRYVNGRFVAVGDPGAFLVSSDGIDWTNEARVTTMDLRSISYGNGVYVGAGMNGVILSSGDGTNWTTRSSGTVNALYGIAYGNETYVIVGDYGTAFASSDGTGWTSQTTGISNTLRGVVYGDGKFVAVGDSGKIISSASGADWDSHASGTLTTLRGIAYGDGVYVAVGDSGTILSSSDGGASWTSRSSGTSNPLQGVIYGKGTFVAVGYSGTIVTSADGVNWVNRSSGVSGILWGGSYYKGKYMVAGYPGLILSSDNGADWSQRASGTSNDLRAISYGNDDFVAVGAFGTILQSGVGTFYTVTFESNGGTAVSDQTVSDGSKLIAPISSRDGYSLAGWYADSGLTTEFDFNTEITADFTLYAKWESHSDKTVAFDSNGGSEVESQTVSYNSQITEPSAPTKEFHTFEGWYTDSSLTVEFNFATPITADRTLYAKWALNSYTVSFNSYGGTSIAPLTVSHGDAATEPSPPTMMGMTFEGWYTDSEWTIRYDFAAEVTSNVELHANWTLTVYTISFDSRGGSAIADQTTYFWGAASEPDDPTRACHTFDGWFRDSSLVDPYLFGEGVVEDITLYAKWAAGNCTVSFESNGGTAVLAQTVSYGDALNEPSVPSRAGYTFEGWYTDSDLTEEYDFAAEVTEDFTLYANWTLNSYTVSFVSNGGTTVSAQTVSYGDAVNEPSVPSRAGYTFEGWYTDSDLTEEYDFAAEVTEDFTLYASWTLNSYTVSFVSNGGTTVSAQTVSYGDAVNEPSVPSRAGYTFEGWYTDSDLTEEYDFAAAVTEDFTLYANWTLNIYRVSFESNGGTTVSAQTVSYRDAVTEPSAPSRAGYTFEGWYTDSDLTEEYDFAAAVTEDFTLYANWTLNSYTVSFESNGGTAVPDQTISYGDAVNEPSVPSRAGYTFEGWYTDSDLTEEYDFAAEVTEDFTLYANWTLNIYRVSFESNGGTAVPDQTVSYGDAVNEPSAPSRAGHTFEGWYTDSDLTEEYDFAAEVTEDFTLYANWKVVLLPSNPVDVSSNDEIIEVNVEDGSNGSVVTTIRITRSTIGNGRKSDTIFVTEGHATEWARSLSAVRSSSARIIISDWNDEVAELSVTIAKGAAERLAGAKIDLEIFTNYTRILIPSRSLSGFSDDLYFRVIPAKNENEREATAWWAEMERLVLDNKESGNIEVLGHPVTIETNMSARLVTIILPLGNTASGNKRDGNLRVYVEHSDGTREAVTGEIVPYDYSDNTGVQFAIDKFSRFTIIHFTSDPMEEASPEAYIYGYPDNTFRPDNPLTRAGVAAILVRLFGSGASQLSQYYSDVVSVYWAKEAIDTVTQSGLMKGYPDGQFKPEQVITRAEMASILAHLINDDLRDEGGFPDSGGHWAQSAIEKVKAAGILNGYSDGMFRPDSSLTRAEAVTMLNKLLNRGVLTDAEQRWTDVPEEHWAYGYIQEASARRTTN